MLRKTLIATLLLLAGAAPTYAARVLEVVERGLELPLEGMTLPATSGGTVQCRICATCAISTHQVTAATEYVFNHRKLALEEFLVAVEEVRDRPSVERRTIAGVYIDLETERVTRIAVVAPRS